MNNINQSMLFNSRRFMLHMIYTFQLITFSIYSLIPPMRRKKLPWLKSFSDVLNFLGLLNVANFSRMGLPSGNASRGRF